MIVCVTAIITLCKDSILFWARGPIPERPRGHYQWSMLYYALFILPISYVIGKQAILEAQWDNIQGGAKIEIPHRRHLNGSFSVDDVTQRWVLQIDSDRRITCSRRQA